MKLLLLAALAHAAFVARTPAEMTSSVRAFFGPRVVGAAQHDLSLTLQTLHSLDPDWKDQMGPVEEAVQEAASKAVARGNLDFAPAEFAREVADEDAERALERHLMLLRTPLSRFLTPGLHAHLSRNEGYYRQFVSEKARKRVHAAMSRVLGEAGLALEGETAAPPKAAERRAMAALKPAQRERPAPKEKPVVTPDWLRGPQPKTGLAAAIDAERQAVQAGIEALASGPAAASALADLSIASKFASSQELAVAALVRSGALEEAERAVAGSPFPHLKALLRPAGGSALFSLPRTASKALKAAGAAALGLSAAVSTSTAAAAALFEPNWPLYFGSLAAAVVSLLLLGKWLNR